MYAEEDFQLLEARTADVRVDMPWRRERPYMNPHAVFSRKRSPVAADQHEYITAVIGKNGTGKSHLLGAIVRTFIALDELRSGKKKSLKELPLKYLEYISDGSHCVVEQDQFRGINASMNGQAVLARDLPLPKRVVALTISPFDKFPVPRTYPYSVVPIESSMYQYLGLRDRFGKASIETLLYRSLNSLFDRTENEALRRSNIGAVFDFLKLKPTVNVIYRLRDTQRLRNAVNRRMHLVEDNVLSPSQQRRVEEAERSGISEGELRMLLELAYERSVRGRIETRADFENGGILDDLFQKLQPIRRAGFLNLTGVEVTHHSGLSSDLRSASSGTISMVSALVALASVISNGSLVLIDEPEISLHPEWQVKYIDLLVKTFGRYRGCHFIVATHSPMVISELPSHAQVISLDQADLPPATELQGQSADFLLAEAFGVPTNGNLHVKERIVEALRLVAIGKARSIEFREIVADLQKFKAILDDDDPSKTIIASLDEVAEHAGRNVRP
ncbi:ATP-binding protein [Methylobrevis albus]|uniref:AAA family ATPase n=1 Tax=Methylobrevis albus TaxID=2793297 RepID=A0A931I744_9HYPH|nr:ATP-binding protein [Methylobrevis albus]MBH0240013.1 AAA family ATPase [Methylobrevis albus]